MRPHVLRDYDDNNKPVATVHPASRESVDYVMSKSPYDDEGRSDWVWVRIANGDLVLGVFPQGDTYIDVVDGDAVFPGEGQTHSARPAT